VAARTSSNYGVEFFLGDGRAIPLRDQDDIAINYLKAHRNDLRGIAEYPGVDTFILGLPYIAKLNASVMGAALSWPRELMLTAVDIGICPTYYITYDRPSELEREPYAHFLVAGAFDPEEITRKVGVTPSKAARAGDTIGSGKIKRQCSVWELHSHLPPSSPVDLHVCDVLDQLDTNRLAFEELSREQGGIIEIVGFSRDYAPPVSLDLEIVVRLAQYGLRLDVTPNC
jgi:hypothetical protein